MARRLEECLAALENPEGKAQQGLFKRKRGGEPLTREQVKAIKEGRKLLKEELKDRGLKSKEDFELTAASMGLYMDQSRGLLWWRWLFFGKGAWALLGGAAALLFALFTLSVVTQLKGHFTINMSNGMFKEGFILSETADFGNPTTHLFCTPVEDVPCVSISHIPKNIDQIDGQHNDAYFAYTFYIRNEGESVVGYDWVISLNAESKNLSTATWVMVFEDGEMLFYAKPNEDGGAEAMPGFGDDSKGFADLEIMGFCKRPEEQFQLIKQEGGFGYYRVVPIAFESDRILARGNQIHVKPGDVHKYTVVIWLEGDDPDCTDALIGGHCGMDFNFKLNSETDKEGSVGQSDSVWDQIWDGMTFWD